MPTGGPENSKKKRYASLTWKSLVEAAEKERQIYRQKYRAGVIREQENS